MPAPIAFEQNLSASAPGRPAAPPPGMSPGRAQVTALVLGESRQDGQIHALADHQNTQIIA
jgi:hypothetical protein